MIDILKKILFKVISAYYNHSREQKYDQLNKAGLNPFIQITTSDKQYTLKQAREQLKKDHMLVPNVSGFYHSILHMYWTSYGLGQKWLLVSETKTVGNVFANKYPNTHFVTTDYYLELQPNPQCDVVWDLCSLVIPVELNQFNSVICQATLEHVIDPIRVISNLVEVIEPQGLLYIQTHTPAFHYHGYPRDYLRYFPDWFIDIPKILGNIDLLDLLCVDGHVFAVYKKRWLIFTSETNIQNTFVLKFLQMILIHSLTMASK